jgi:hypothetical protein
MLRAVMEYLIFIVLGLTAVVAFGVVFFTGRRP